MPILGMLLMASFIPTVAHHQPKLLYLNPLVARKGPPPARGVGGLVLAAVHGLAAPDAVESAGLRKFGAPRM